jgi:putative acetyltransferase
MNITIKPLTIDSYDKVLALWQMTEGIGLSSADSKKCINSYLERNPGMSFVASTTDGKIIGAILAGHDGRRGYIHHLSVNADFRRQGLGSQMVAKCQQKLQEAGLQKCHVFIFNDNTTGIKFWKSIGWIYRRDLEIISKNIEQVV